MAERKATNKYYPPDWNPSKGSINKFQGSHPLRERARKLHEGILIIRFELPFNIWCDGCNNHIGMGVRYNAQKSKVGMYYTAPLYKFRMKCHLCDNHFEIQNDPKNRDYTILNGARRQENRWDPVENEQIDVDKSVAKKIKLDPMFKLEHDTIDKTKAVENKSAIENLERFQSRLKDDYSANCIIRRSFRTKKKELKDVAISNVRLLQKYSLPISLKLATETEHDTKMAQLMKLQSRETPEQKKMAQRKRIMNRSIFGKSKLNPLLKAATVNNDKKKSSNLQRLKQKQMKMNVKLKPKCLESIVDYNSSPDESS